MGSGQDSQNEEDFKMCSLTDLPDEILCKILKFCDPPEIFRLRRVCRRFHDIVETSVDFLITADALVTNQKDDEMKERSEKILPTELKWKVSKNWRTKDDPQVTHNFNDVLTYFNIERDSIHCTFGRSVNWYERSQGSFNLSVGVPVVSAKSEIVTAKISNRYVVATSERRTLLVHSRSTSKTYKKSRPNIIGMVDLKDDVMVTVDVLGFTLWNNIEEKETLSKIMKKQSGCQLVSVALNPLDTYLATYSCANALQVFDYSAGVYKQVTKKGFRLHVVRDSVKWMDKNNILISHGLDVELLDMRVGAVVSEWSCPNLWYVTCIDTDKVCTLMVGTNSFGGVHLFDTRRYGCVKTYNFDRSSTSQISGVSFDAENLLASINNRLHIMNFS